MHAPPEIKISNKNTVVGGAGGLKPGVETEQPAKTAYTAMEGGVGPEIKTDFLQSSSSLKRLLKSCFKTSDCCLAVSLVPTWMTTFLVCGCLLKRDGMCCTINNKDDCILQNYQKYLSFVCFITEHNLNWKHISHYFGHVIGPHQKPDEI